MNVGDIQKHQINGKIIEHIVTQEEVDEYNAQVAEQQKQDILNELEELSKKLPDLAEEPYINQGYTMMPEMQTIKNQKDQLKQDYFNLTGEHLPCCLDTSKLNDAQTTRIDFGDAIIDMLSEIETLKSEIETLKGGV